MPFLPGLITPSVRSSLLDSQSHSSMGTTANLSSSDLADMPGPADVRRCPCGWTGCTHGYAKRGTLRYYQNHLGDPAWRVLSPDGTTVVAQSPLSTRQVVYSLLELHERHRIAKSELDTILGFYRATLPTSFIPPSIYMLRMLTGAADWSEFEVHVCAADGCPGYVYPKLSRSSWDAHRDDVCCKCCSRRFLVKSRGGGFVFSTCVRSFCRPHRPVTDRVLFDRAGADRASSLVHRLRTGARHQGAALP